jgi:hypothetical protein
MGGPLSWQLRHCARYGVPQRRHSAPQDVDRQLSFLGSAIARDERTSLVRAGAAMISASVDGWRPQMNGRAPNRPATDPDVSDQNLNPNSRIERMDSRDGADGAHGDDETANAPVVTRNPRSPPLRPVIALGLSTTAAARSAERAPADQASAAARVEVAGQRVRRPAPTS